MKSAKVLLALLVLLESTVEGKVGSCRTKFNRKMSSDYCSKFGTAQHTTMELSVRSRVVNHQSVTPSAQATHFKIEVAVFADQDYEKLEAKDNVTCKEKREAALRILTVVVPTDGGLSDDYAHEENTKVERVSTQGRPRIYYFELLDCSSAVTSVFRTGQFPRLLTEIAMTTEEGAN